MADRGADLPGGRRRLRAGHGAAPGGLTRRMRILHISADFPDPLRPAKTRAVANLLDLVPEHQHTVYSLNRVGWHYGISALIFGDDHRAVAYGAPGGGVFLAHCLDRLARWILRDLTGRGMRFELVHAHKLSVEGLLGERLADQLCVPLVISSQGNSDLKIIRARPDLRPRWRRIWRDAAAVLPFAPWTAEGLGRLLGPRANPVICLPCPTPADRIIAPRRTPPVVRAVFGLDGQANKNAPLLIRAARIVVREIPDFRLEFVGGGRPASIDRLARAIRGQPWITLIGPVAHDTVQTLLNGSACLAVPSRRESYGMVFAEALLAGCPVLRGAGNGIDGYFPDADFAVPATGNDARALADRLIVLLRDQDRIKTRLHAAQQAGDLALLRRPAIAETYRPALEQCRADGVIAKARAA